jgi:hypothetical protein
MGYKMLCGSLDEVQNEIFAFVGGLVGWILCYEVQNVFCVGTTKCRQIVMRQLYVDYVIVEYLHV